MTELQILDGFQKLHNPILDSIMIFITSLGNVGFIWLAIIAVLLMNKKQESRNSFSDCGSSQHDFM